MRCPICDADNPDDLPECANCGSELAGVRAEIAELPDPDPDLVVEDVLAMPDLEPTLHVAADVRAHAMEGLERTAVAHPGLRVAVEAIEVERTALELDEGGPSSWTGEVELETGREEAAGTRTPNPDESPNCPWCGAESASAVCDTCGRQRSKFLKPQEDSGEARLCPSCFAKVPVNVRCAECGIPFAPREL